MDSVTGRIKEARKMGGRILFCVFFFSLKQERGENPLHLLLLLPSSASFFFKIFLTAIVSGGYKRRSLGSQVPGKLLCSTKKVSQVSTHSPPLLSLK